MRARREAKWMHYSIAEPDDPTVRRVFAQTLDALRDDPAMQRDLALLTKALFVASAVVVEARSQARGRRISLAVSGGGGGIRTYGPVAGTAVFKTAAAAQKRERSLRAMARSRQRPGQQRSVGLARRCYGVRITTCCVMLSVIVAIAQTRKFGSGVT